MDSEPLFMQMNLVNGQCPLVWPNSAFNDSANLLWLNDGVITLAITQFCDIALITDDGPCPAPNIP